MRRSQIWTAHEILFTYSRKKGVKLNNNLYTFPAIYFRYGTLLIHTVLPTFWSPVIAGHKFIFMIPNAGFGHCTLHLWRCPIFNRF